MQADCSGVYVCLISSGLEKDEDFLPPLGWGCKSSIPFSVFIMFRKMVGLLPSIKNLIFEAKLKQKHIKQNIFLYSQLLF